jgi:hypothetical protein
MRIDPAVIDSYFANKLKRGAVLRFLMQCDDPQRDERYKFGIYLNVDPYEPDAFLALTTSKTEKYDSGRFENDIVRLPEGVYPCFDRPTIVVLREIRIEPVSLLKEQVGQQCMTFEIHFDEAAMTEIDAKIRNSRLIEGRMKRRIVVNP